MKAIRIHETGDAGVLRLEEIPVPTPGPGQVLLRVEATGVNFIEIYHRTGLYKIALPAALGTEAAGTVEALGPGVTTVQPGDRVASVNVLGAYAEYALAPADRLVQLPDRVSTPQGAAVMLQGITAHYLTTSTFPLQRGQTCLVHAAAGGLGLLLCQMARRIGARIIATVSTEQKAALARQAGADDVILYTQTDFEPEVKRLTAGAGVQVVYDSVGRTTFAKGLNCVARRGMMVLLGQSSGPVEPFDPQILSQKGSLFLTRPSLGHYTATRAELLERAGEVLGWVADGSLSVRIGREFPLAQAADAHRELEGRRTTGKLLLIP
ncbi:MAG: quinone oxidoreductase family protein [Gemmatimonadales bacterium]